MKKTRSIIRIIFLFFLALIPSIGIGFAVYVIPFSLYPPFHIRVEGFVSAIVSFISTFVILFILLLVSDKRKRGKNGKIFKLYVKKSENAENGVRTR